MESDLFAETSQKSFIILVTNTNLPTLSILLCFKAEFLLLFSNDQISAKSDQVSAVSKSMEIRSVSLHVAEHVPSVSKSLRREPPARPDTQSVIPSVTEEDVTAGKRRIQECQQCDHAQAPGT